MFGRLMTARRFAPLFWCQFFSAFNDNFVKNALALLVLFHIGSSHGQELVTLAGALFILPFFILSSVGGEMADRFDKAVVARRLKLVEILVVAVAGVGFVLHDPWILLAALTGMGVLGALFGPIKYGILPDHLPREELVAGNALVETATFLAILAGTVGGGIAIAELDPIWVAVTTVVFGAVSYGAAWFIPHTGSRAPDLRIEPNVAKGTVRLLRALRAQTGIWRGALVVSWFWAVGAVALALMPPLVKTHVGGNESVVTLFLCLFVVGIAAGSMLAARLSRGRILLSLAPIGAALMGLAALDLGLSLALREAVPESVTWATYFDAAGSVRAAIDLVGLAAAGGLLVVPVFAWMQASAGEDERARVIAGNNVLNAAFMVAASLVVLGLQMAGLDAATIMAVVGAANLVAALIIARMLPGGFLRDVIYLIYRICFRLEVVGAENLRTGRNVVVTVNHVSFLDAPLIMALLDSDPVFAIDQTIAKAWWVKPFLKISRTFALDPTKPMATRALINQVKAGDSLVIFPEGRITRTGSLMKIYDGAALIADKGEAPVVPVRIEGLEQTPFSHLDGRQTRKRLFPKVRVTILPARRLEVDQSLVGRRRRQAAGAALTDVMSELVFLTTPFDRTVPEAVAAAAAKYGGKRVVVEDPLGTVLTYRTLTIGAAVLAAKLEDAGRPGQAVGVLLPTSGGVAVVVLALMRAGRVPAMLNFSAGPANLVAACAAAGVATVVTSRAFVEKARLDKEIAALGEVARIVHLEDVRAGVGRLDKLRGVLAARRLPALLTPDSPAAILFTSGSEGTPKGVVLSHRNLLANCAQLAARIDFGPADIVFNALPVFHSFGLTGGLVLPLVFGLKTYLYPSPLHYRIIPELVYGINATAIFGTDTFLAGYARAANPYDFRSIRYVVAGAEAVKPETRRVWSEKFGLRILEGYGITEASPVVAVNTPMFNRVGTVGRLLPGIEHRLEAVDGIDEGGRLHIRGPNVMLGYFRVEAPGVLEPPADGWHDTGDIVTLDDDGFVAIKGRAKRFAKIAGEMVSLAAVEDLARDIAPGASHAAVAVPDARKGERIVLVTTDPHLTRATLLDGFRARHASELAVPAEIVVLDALPLLGSGKTDYVTLGREMRARAEAKGAAE